MTIGLRGLVLFAGCLASGIAVVTCQKSASLEYIAKMEEVSDSATVEVKKKSEEHQASPRADAQPLVAQFEAGYHGGRTLKITLKDEQLRFITSEGKKLLFSPAKIRRIDFAYTTRKSKILNARIDAAIVDLGNDEFSQREKASAELRRLGGRAYPAILKALENQDPEIVLRAGRLLNSLRNDALDEETFAELVQHDILYTTDSKFVGRVDTKSLTMYTSQTDEVPPKAADLDFLQSLSVDLAVSVLKKLGGQMIRDKKSNAGSVLAIDFSKSQFTSRKFKEFRQLSAPLATLRAVNFASCGITNEDLRELKNFGRIQELILDKCTQVTSAGLKKLKELQALSFCDCCITDLDLREFKELKKIHSLNLGGCRQITDEGLKELKDLKKLQRLVLSCCDVTDEGLKELKNLKFLMLNLSQCDITDEGLKELKNLNRLWWLRLYGCDQITDASLRYLKNFKHIKCLGLMNCRQITDAGLKELKELKNLEDLNLAGCDRITNIGLKELWDVKALQSLDLSFCKWITIAGLKGFKDLKLLTLKGCAQISDAELRKNLPKVRISRTD